jgi:hypothetical protein
MPSGSKFIINHLDTIVITYDIMRSIYLLVKFLVLMQCTIILPCNEYCRPVWRVTQMRALRKQATIRKYGCVPNARWGRSLGTIRNRSSYRGTARDNQGRLPDYKQLVTTPTGLKKVTRWMIKRGMLGQYQRASGLLYLPGPSTLAID